MGAQGRLGWLAALGLWLAAMAAQAAVELPSGQYHTTAQDLTVAVPGGAVVAEHTWYQGRWYFNSAWSPLDIEYDAIDGSVRTLTRNGDVYKRNADGTRFIYDARKSIVPLAGGGFRWEDRQGNWIEYDDKGQLTRYGDRNDIQVSLTYDAEGRRTGVVDTNGRQVLWYTYDADGHLTGVRDGADPASARTVGYAYTNGLITTVTDVRGQSWHYEYRAVIGGTAHLINSTSTETLDLSAATSLTLVKRTDPLGRATTIAYTGGRTTQVTYPDGTATEYTYDYDSTRKEYYTRTSEPGGKVTERWYNKTSEVIRRDINGRTVYKMRRDGTDRIITNARGLETVKAYDAWDNLVGITYPDGTSVHYTLDPTYSNVLEKVDENGIVTQYAYDDHGNLTRMTEAKGKPAERVTEYTYDASGRLTAVKRLADANTAEALTTFGNFDAAGHPQTVTDPEGAVHTYTYNNAGQVLTETDPRGKIWTRTYDGAGHLLTVADPLNHTVTYQYDAVGNLIKRIGPSPYHAETTYAYDAQDGQTSVTNALGKVTHYDLDSAGRLVRLSDPSGRVVAQLAYDSEGHLTQAQDGAGNVTSYDYGLGSSSTSLYPGLLNAVNYPTYTEQYAYDKRDRATLLTERFNGSSRNAALGYNGVGQIKTLTDAKSRTTGWEYDALGRPTTALDPASGTTTYTYDDRDNLLSVTNARGVVIGRYEYDRTDRLIREIRPDDSFYQYTYDDAAGTVIRFDAKGQKTRYVVDAAGRLTTVEYYPDASAVEPVKTVSFSYDERDLLTGYDDGTTSADYTYDLLGRKTGETVNYGTFSLSYSYTYDAAGRKTAFTGPDNVTITYSYDTAGRPATITLPGVGTLAYTAFTWSQPRKLTLPGGGDREWQYDGLMRPSHITGKDPAGNPVLDIGYGYDAVDNILSKTTGSGNYSYTYDALDRLTGADNPSLPDEAYTYDAVGNRTSDASTTGQWSYSDADELQGYDGVSFTYDANGSLTQKDDNGTVTKYAYNLENRLSEVRDGADSLIASYCYDPFGRRLWKEVGGTRTYFLYADEGLIAEADGSGNVTRQYGWQPGGAWGTDPLYLKNGGQTYFYQNDHLGTPQKLVAINGAVVWSANYASFGAVQMDIAQVENPLRFPGQYFDQETGLYYNWLRYYDFTAGRYINSDPTGLDGGINVYVYVSANPLLFIDPFGLDRRHTQGRVGESMAYNEAVVERKEIPLVQPHQYKGGADFITYDPICKRIKYYDNKALSNGNTVNYASGLTRDVLNRTRAEEAIQAAVKEGRMSQADGRAAEEALKSSHIDKVITNATTSGKPAREGSKLSERGIKFEDVRRGGGGGVRAGGSLGAGGGCNMKIPHSCDFRMRYLR